VGGGWLERPAGIEEAQICTETGLRPAIGCGRVAREFFPAGAAPHSACRPKEETLMIECPRPWDRFQLDAKAPTASRFVRFRARAPEGARLVWILGGRHLATTSVDHEVLWPAAAGSFELEVRGPGIDVVRRFEVRQP
jgi:hypothetical protein